LAIFSLQIPSERTNPLSRRVGILFHLQFEDRSIHSAALTAKQTQLSALPRRTLRRCGGPWAVPNTQGTLLKKRPITQFVECLGQPRDHRRDAEYAEVTQRIRCTVNEKDTVTFRSC